MHGPSLSIALVLSFVIGPRLFAQGASPADAIGSKSDEQAIRARAKEFLSAVGRGDAKALGDLWTPDGDLVDEQGRSTPARELIEQEAKAASAGPRPPIKLVATTIRFLTPDVAIEDGTSEVTPKAAASAPPVQGRFTAIWVRRDGKWRLATVREARLDATSGAPQLAELEWMVGDWSGTTNQATIDVSVHWNSTHSLLIREMKVVHDGHLVFNGIQRINWDAAAGKIKSWMMDSDGGYGEGTWTKDGDAWMVRATGVLADGRRTSSVNICTPVGKDSFTWQSTGTKTNSGESVPDLEIKLVRKPTGQ